MYKLINDPVTAKLICINNLVTGASFGAHEDNIDYAKFKKDILEGAELLDADGQVMQDAIQFVNTLP